MKRVGRLFDGLRARIAAALFLALIVQFVGSELIFAQVQSARMERGRAQRLADWLSFAEEFAVTRPDATQRMTRLWQSDLIVARSTLMPAHRARPLTGEEARVQRMVVTGRPQLGPHLFLAHRDGADLTGSLRLDDGGWLSFRAPGYFTRPSQFGHYLQSILVLALCVGIIALLFGRMIARPLAQIADAAGRVGREEAVSIAVEGPREVRQVAAAFDRMQARLLTHVKERVDSLAAISHDLRTPIARLRLNASTVADVDTRDALQADVSELEAFVTSILDYLRGDDAEPLQRADVASIVMTVVDEARDRDESASYDGPDRFEMDTRPLKLKRLVRNLVQNAVRYGGTARVALTTRPDGITVTIDDDGPGIPDDRIAAAFAPFTRIDTSRSRRTGGVGLGLTIVRTMAQRLDGSVTLHNRVEGGLRAIVELPLAKPADADDRTPG